MSDIGGGSQIKDVMYTFFQIYPVSYSLICRYVNTFKMSLKVKLFDREAPTAAPSTNWKLCCFCQDPQDPKLVCPIKKPNDLSGYKTLANYISLLKGHRKAPLNIDLRRLDDGYGIEETFITNKAQWHKSCRLIFQTQTTRLTEKRTAEENNACDISPKKTRQNCDVSRKDFASNLCFFCDKEETRYNLLTSVSDGKVDQNVRECATVLRDTKLLAKLADKDMKTQGASYHLTCLTDLYRKGTKPAKDPDSIDADKPPNGLILGELISYIEDSRDKDEVTVFKLADLVKLYNERLHQFDTNMHVHQTTLKERLLKAVPGLKAEKRGKYVYLHFADDLGQIIFQACNASEDNDAIHLMRAAQIVRSAIFEKSFEFTGTFEKGCETKAVPSSLRQLISMILEGTNIQDQMPNDDDVRQKISLSMSQLVMYHSVRKSHSSKQIRHIKAKETPLPLYISLYIHHKTRNRDIIDKLHEYGLGVSYTRVLDITATCGQNVIEQFKHENVVCPTKALKGITTGGMIDNLDANLRSKLSQQSFHGTAISLAQSPTLETPGQTRQKVSIDSKQKKASIRQSLPPSFSIVPAVAMTNKEPRVPFVAGEILPETVLLWDARDKERAWLSNARNSIGKDDVEEDDYISWAAYHASNLPPQTHPKSIVSLMPLFYENAHTPAMLLHGMHVVRDAVNFLNPGQTPFITGDQPLYALMKQCQWQWPEDVGEDKYVVLMGGLHFEMAITKTLGQWLDGSGWSTALADSGITTSGRADDAVKGGNVTRSRYFHQVTATALHILQQNAYEEYQKNCFEDDPEANVKQFKDWSDQMCKDQPQFYYWSETLQLELDSFIFVRSIREADFLLYREALRNLLPMLHALDHINYGRWASIHLRDMMLLETTHPDLFAKFMKGDFTVQKSMKSFSNIATDHAHEQENATIKGNGGAIGLFQDENALLRWMVAGPEICRVIEEFEDSSGLQDLQPQTKHHEQNKSFQSHFKADVIKLVKQIKEMGNPFMDDSGTLYALDTKNVMSDKVVSSLRAARETGEQQLQDFVNDRIMQEVNKPVTDTMKKNKLPSFSNPISKTEPGHTLKLKSIKSDSKLFAEMYISTQRREGDIGEFFKHENNSNPPSISQYGHLRKGTKADLVKCLTVHCELPGTAPHVQAKLLDGPAVVQILHPKGCKSFEEYASDVFIPSVKNHLLTCDRVDVVWDVYRPDSLKAETRESRGKGIRRKVKANTPIPANWQNFLRVDENKTELYGFLADHLVQSLVPDNKMICTTKGDIVLSSNPELVDDSISPSTHEEADTRLLLHAAHCVSQGKTRILIRTVDTDVLVLAIACCQQIANLEELFVAFGVGKSFKYIPAHEIARSLGPLKSKSLPMFHAITGCDTTSSFGGKGKKSAWDTWLAYPSVTDAFLTLSQMPETISDECLEKIERFIIVMYSRTCQQLSCDEARRDLFSRGKSMDNIPPTSHAMLQHVKRSVLQAGHCWVQSLVSCPNLPSPSDWGWKVDESSIWRPFWTTLPEASKGCRELLRCGCKSQCANACGCASKDLKCTELCLCKGGCANN